MIDTVSVMPYAAIGAVHADPVDPMPVHEGHALLHELTPEAVEALLAVAGPASGSLQVIVELRHLGGAMARPAAHRSAFCHRDAAFSVATIGALMPEIAELVQGTPLRWSTRWPLVDRGALPNFGPSADATRVARCYDEDTLHWLAALAQRYDPPGSSG